MTKTVAVVMTPSFGPNIIFENVKYIEFYDEMKFFYIEFEEGYLYFSKENVMYIKVKKDV